MVGKKHQNCAKSPGFSIKFNSILTPNFDLFFFFFFVSLYSTKFRSNDKEYQNVLIPNIGENMLVLGKKIQEKHTKTRGFSTEYSNIFKQIMESYRTFIANNSYIALGCLKSKRLTQLLLNDEQTTSTSVIDTLRRIFEIKYDILERLDDKTLYLILDEIIYKIVNSESPDVGSYVSSFNSFNSKQILIEFKLEPSLNFYPKCAK
jgi:hypothetical protein